jgi:hypothetical protein
VAIPVRNSGDIRNAIQPIQTRDLPGSTFERVRMIANDIDLVAGLSDQADPSAGSQTTATGAQLVQSQLGLRILLGSRRFELEVVKNAARAFLKLNQRMIVSERPPIRLENPEFNEELPQEGVSRWKWFELDPSRIQGQFEPEPEGGSMAAKNIPQERQDGQQVMALFGSNPHVDPRRPLMYALKKFGLKSDEAQAWLAKPETPVPQSVFKLLEEGGVDAELIQYAVKLAQRSDPQLAPPEGEPMPMQPEGVEQ